MVDLVQVNADQENKHAMLENSSEFGLCIIATTLLHKPLIK